MIKNKYVLQQILSLVPRYQFNKIVSRHSNDYTVKSFTYWEQFICLSYGQLAQKETLRTIVLGLSSRKNKLYHLGIRSSVKRSTLSDANRIRSSVIYQEIAYVLIDLALKSDFNRKKTSIFNEEDARNFEQLNQELKGAVYALDSSTIDLCLSIFSWAKFRKKRWHQTTYFIRLEI